MMIDQGGVKVPVLICDGCGGLVPETMLTVHSAYVHGETRDGQDIAAWLDSLDVDELTADLANQPLSVGPVEAVLGTLRSKAATSAAA